MIEIQNPRGKFLGHLKFDDWDLFGIWNLSFGICDCPAATDSIRYAVYFATEPVALISTFAPG